MNNIKCSQGKGLLLQFLFTIIIIQTKPLKQWRYIMALYVISDIHGEIDRFHRMLQKIQFTNEDTLYILGDVVDRGPCGITLIQEIMNTKNIVMLLGNHEYMMLDYFRPDVTDVEIRRWNCNGNEPTLAQFTALTTKEQEEILEFLRGLPTHMTVEIADHPLPFEDSNDFSTKQFQRFHLVHGFVGENVHDEVWNRPTLATPNPLSDVRLIVGHTPISSLVVPREERADYIAELESRGEHLRIHHAPGFIDIDCGCGHSYPVKALACLRLEDMTEFYV